MHFTPGGPRQPRYPVGKDYAGTAAVRGLDPSERWFGAV